MTPTEFIEKLAALVPPPRVHLIRYHGVLAPHAADRCAGDLPRAPSAPRGAGVGRLSWSPLSSSFLLDAVARRRGRAVP